MRFSNDIPSFNKIFKFSTIEEENISLEEKYKAILNDKPIYRYISFSNFFRDNIVSENIIRDYLNKVFKDTSYYTDAVFKTQKIPQDLIIDSLKFLIENKNEFYVRDAITQLIDNNEFDDYIIKEIYNNFILNEDNRTNYELSIYLNEIISNSNISFDLQQDIFNDKISMYKISEDDEVNAFLIYFDEGLSRNINLIPEVQKGLIQNGTPQNVLKNLLKNPNLNKDLIDDIFEKLTTTKGEEFKSIDSQNFNLHKYKKNEDKYKEIKLEIESLENQLENEQDNQKRNKIINKINRLKNSIPEYKIYENLDEKLTSNDGKTFISQERTWSKGSGQNFTNSDEKVILLYPSKDILKESLQDPLLKKFFDSYWAGSHFNDKTSPIGWALIYEYDKNTWIINQIQSDIVSQFLRIYNNAKNNTQNSEKPKIDTEELAIILKTNNRSGYIELLNQPQYSNVLEQLLYHPEEINGLPEANTIEEAQNNVQEVQRIQQDLVNRGHLSVDENDVLSNLSIEQLDYIREKLNYVINEWYYHVFQNVWLQAKENGVTDLYMNTSKSLSGGANEGKSIFLYEKLPKELGFVKENVNLRGQEEKLWHRKASFNLNRYKISSYKKDFK